jgi:hypothetical protein
MDRIQFLLHSLTWFFQISSGLVSLYVHKNKKAAIWLLSGLYFFIVGINNFFNLSKKFGDLLLTEKFGFIFFSIGIVLIIALFNIFKERRISLIFLLIAAVSFLATSGLGYALAIVEHEAADIVILQLSKDFLEATGSMFILLSFLSYCLKPNKENAE